MIYVHIGAGAGDLDAGAHFRDGFSEFVKKNNDQNKEIYLVEANPSNISKLKESWKDYRNVEIFNFAITSSKQDEKRLKFFYSLEILSQTLVIFWCIYIISLFVAKPFIGFLGKS